jgi:glucan phosphoethanolaminetransferase (alkaline phosphatase superfamily)
LFQPERADFFKRWTAAALFVECLIIVSHFSLAERYATELYPFLIFCFLVFLSAGTSAPVRLRYLIGVLVVCSIAINSMTTISWLIGADQNVPAETRDAWKAFIGASNG